MEKLVYKYKSFRTVTEFLYFLDILQNNRLYFPSYTELNDPFESNTTEINLTGYAGFSIEQNADKEDRYIAEEKQKYHILSMSGTCRSPLMWAHYADNYQGACLCFSSDKTFSSLKRVEYCTERKVYDMISGSSNVTELVRKSFGQKNSEWSYEHEWRMIERNDDKLPQKYIRFEQGELKGLILGHRMPSEIHDYLKNVLPEEVKLLKTYIGHRTYKIQLLPDDENVSFDGSIPAYVENLEKYLLSPN